MKSIHSAAVAAPISGAAVALDVIRELAAQGHALSYIAGALARRGVPAPSGRGRWHHHAVARIAAEHGVPVGFGRRSG